MRISVSIFAFLVFVGGLPDHILACTSAGASPRDERVAWAMCEMQIMFYGRKRGIEHIEVHDTVSYVVVTESAYRKFYADRIAGNRFMRGLVRNFQERAGQKFVSVDLKLDKDTVARAKTEAGGDIRIMWLDR